MIADHHVGVGGGNNIYDVVVTILKVFVMVRSRVRMLVMVVMMSWQWWC